jgi:hypothetical protein
VSAEFAVTPSGDIWVQVPAGAQTGVISVTTPGGRDTAAAIFTVVPPVPALDSVTPFTPVSGYSGQSVTLHGTDLGTATSVTFAGSAGSRLSAVITDKAATTLTVIIPSGTVTGGTITVTTPGGTATSLTTFTIVPAPGGTVWVSGITPASGLVGDTFVIDGGGFQSGVSTVSLNGTPVTSFTVDSSSQITARVPAGSTSGQVKVTTGLDYGYSPVNYTVVYPPTISGLAPTHALVGATVTITGTHFTDKSEVRFFANNTAGWVRVDTFAVVSATRITAKVPATAATGTVIVVTNDGSATSGTNFTVDLPVPTITSLPATADIGTTISIGGTNFTGATTVTFMGTNQVLATPQVVDDTLIKVTIPVGATSGPIQITNAYGTGTSTTNIAIGGSASGPTAKNVTLPSRYKVLKTLKVVGASSDYQLLSVKSSRRCSVTTTLTGARVAGYPAIKLAKIKTKSKGVCVLTILQYNVRIGTTSRYQWTMLVY